jgi:hypothetical protein
MHLNKHEKGIKHTTIHCTLFNILYYGHKIDKNKYKNENRVGPIYHARVSCPICFLLTPEIQKKNTYISRTTV